jgi:hypothetical protein
VNVGLLGVYGDHTAEPIARTACTVSAGTPSSSADPTVARASAARPNGWSAPAGAAYRTDDLRSGAQSASVIRVNTSGKEAQVAAAKEYEVVTALPRRSGSAQQPVLGEFVAYGCGIACTSG